MFRLADVMQPLTDAQMEKLTNGAVKRILNSEKAIARTGMAHVSQAWGEGSAERSLINTCSTDRATAQTMVRYIIVLHSSTNTAFGSS